jgi:hypothetical protein
MSGRPVRGALLLVLLAAVVAPAVRAGAEERTVNATSPWEGRARVFVTGPHQGFMLGVFTGQLAVDGGAGSLHGARLACPGAVEADYAANTQRGEGRCIVTTGTGDRVFARWTCAGEPDKGCAGRFVLTGGTGVYQGVTGEGDMAIRLVLTNLINLERLEAEYDLAGIVSWSGLRYRTP